tara:strand:- start:138 stop:308 length:171 start_codon:yes stop_codon:yes gene_type:complete
MPYQIKKVKGGYFLEDTKGIRLEKKPLKTRKEAEKQRIAVYLSKKKAGKDIKNFFI